MFFNSDSGLVLKYKHLPPDGLEVSTYLCRSDHPCRVPILLYMSRLPLSNCLCRYDHIHRCSRGIFYCNWKIPWEDSSSVSTSLDGLLYPAQWVRHIVFTETTFCPWEVGPFTLFWTILRYLPKYLPSQSLVKDFNRSLWSLKCIYDNERITVSSFFVQMGNAGNCLPVTQNRITKFVTDKPEIDVQLPNIPSIIITLYYV